MVAVLQKNFFGNEFNVVVNTPETIDMTGQRCDPVFGADFQEATDNTTFNTPGWINFAEAGSTLWSEDVFSGNGTARFSAFSSGVFPHEVIKIKGNSRSDRARSFFI